MLHERNLIHYLLGEVRKLWNRVNNLYDVSNEVTTHINNNNLHWPVLGASLAVVTTPTGLPTTVAGVSATEVSYLGGVTSDIQTQLNSMVRFSLGWVGGRALYGDSLERAFESVTTSTELGYLSGVTSAIQTQINTANSKITDINTDVSNLELDVSNNYWRDTSNHALEIIVTDISNETNRYIYVPTTKDHTINNSDVYTADIDISNIPLEANSVYSFEAAIVWRLVTSANPDWKVRFYFNQTDWTMFCTYVASATASANESSGNYCTIGAITNTSTGSRINVFHGTIETVTAGTFRMEWAQNTATAEDTLRRHPSWVRLVKSTRNV